MSRCKACDEVMSDTELAMTNPQTGEPEDLCFGCLGSAMDAVLEDEGDNDDSDITLEELDALIKVALDEDNSD